MNAMAEPRHARPKGWKFLRRTLIAGAILLSPAFFIVMYATVTALVRPTFGIWAWTVPVATEGCFLLLYGLDILSQLWSALYLQPGRSAKLLSGQAEYQARILPALAAQLMTETTGCGHDPARGYPRSMP